MNITQIDKPRLIIIGGGFAGLHFARKINSDQYQVVLFDKNNYHTFQPLMYQVATSGLEPDSIAHPLRKSLQGKKNVHFRYGEVLSVDSKNKIIKSSIGELSYDYLVICSGAKTNFFGMHNVEKLAFPMKSLNESLQLRSRILQNFEDAIGLTNLEDIKRKMTFVIAGGGATGVELAGAFSELKNKIFPRDYPELDLRMMQIHIIQGAPKILFGMSEHASKKAEEFLEKLGVNIWKNTHVMDFDGKTVTATNDLSIETNTLIWAAGVEGNDIQSNDELTVEKHRYPVNEFCLIQHSTDTYAIGDVAYFTDTRYEHGLPMLASVAMQQGVYLAEQFNRISKGKKTKPFVYKNKGSMATIGRNKAVVDLKSVQFSGIFAWLTWMFVHVMLLIGFRNRVIVLVNWIWNYILFSNGNRLIIRKAKTVHQINKEA